MVMLTLVGTFVLAQTPTTQPAAGTVQQEQPTQQPSGMNPQDIKTLQDGAAALGKAFGIEQPKPHATVPPTPEKPKSFADVADKGLDMVKNLVITLAETLEKVAPEIWRVMVRQQYAKAISGLVLPWGLFLVTILYTVILKKIWKDENLDSEDRAWRGGLTTFLPFVAGIVFAIWGCVNLKDSVLLLINPEYYAIRDLLIMILSPGTAG